MSRGEGKTTAQLTNALNAASHGETVFYMTKGPTHYYADLAMKLAKDAGKHPTFNRAENRLTFFRSGSIYFREGSDDRSAEERVKRLMQGISRSSVAWDHALSPEANSDD